ncbi:MAG: ATP-binding protein [Lachnospiraceae bacterium]|nr:ATP-binding protein [Lachnospiraceae bacterium]
MDNKKYKPRLVDKKIKEYLKTFGAVCVEGPKWCGKTWTSAYHSASQILIGSPENNFQNRKLAELSPGLVLEGDIPRLIDEWQEVPPLWDAVRYEVDKRAEKGQFLLTGSATPNHKGIMHSGAGRIAKLRMRPMSLYESGNSSGAVSLSNILEGEVKPSMTGEVSLRQLLDLIVRGGWPGNLEIPMEQAVLLPAEYLNAVIDDDVFRIDGVKRDARKIRLLLKSLARNESTTATNKKLKNDIKEIDDEDINIDTVAEYLDIFNRLFITENQPPFASRIRSSVRVKQAEKRHFVDPSLACAVLGVTTERLMNDLETAGFLFEALCERDLRIYAEACDGALYHYQDYAGKEIDAVVEFRNGDWIALEIKLGANQIDAAAENLISIRDSIAQETAGVPPKALCVICGMSNAVYQRPDGVYVVPITALKQ